MSEAVDPRPFRDALQRRDEVNHDSHKLDSRIADWCDRSGVSEAVMRDALAQGRALRFCIRDGDRLTLGHLIKPEELE